MEEQILLTERAESVALLRLNRPHMFNALDYPLIDALAAALDELETDDSVRAIVLTGAGDRAFSAGADIACFALSVRRGVETALREFVRRGHRLTGRIETFPKPVIVAVNGIAFGGGCEIVEAAPLAIASDRAKFGKPEIHLGFPPSFGGTQRLPRLVGRKRALKMILTGEPFGAEEALAIGLVNEEVPHERLIDAAVELGHRIASQSPLAVTACLTSVTRGINLPIDEGLAVEAAQFGRMVVTEDIREGIVAFMERRAPAFSSR
jgi:enoyl-CoA hydratase/carnithine racemase